MTTSPEATLAQTREGLVRGVREGELTVWRGIRYAEAPVGEHRFAPPRPVRPWDGVRDATRLGAEPIQVALPIPGFPQPGPDQREDCLFLNVWSPSTRGRRPVIVWINGGGFIGGAGSHYDGSVYARRHDVVFVTFNYRVNAFGYLHQPERPGSGNCGLLDQIEALRWVRDNIAGFGGDPAAVTVMGESAGGGSIGAMLGAPAARGLFRRAIVQSGSPGWLPMPQGLGRTTEVVLDNLGVTADELTEVPAADLLEASKRVRPGVKSQAYHPVVDGDVLPRHPLEGLTGEVDVLIGTCDKDFIDLGPQVLNPLEYVIRHFYGDDAWDRLLAVYTQTTSAGRDPRQDVLCGAFTQLPSIWLADGLVRAGAKVWQYTFDYAGAGPIGATHASDVPFTFGRIRPEVLAPGADPAVAQEVADTMVHSFATFARTGDPGTPALPRWPAITPDDKATLSFDEAPRLKQDRLSGQRLAAWRDFDPLLLS
ncbi:carboxylesterase/lipase family protein [Kutzneria sp. NPDC052558]|uniref:carboxylesterase/lipase family protein n=1 Tax=Kutzneria sp. NPDC052558 TaxID=3364121 RepID=UPI0037CAC713